MRNTSFFSLNALICSLMFTSGCSYTKPVTLGAPSYSARHAWNLEKGQPIVVVRTNGDSIFGKFQFVVDERTSPPTRYRMKKSFISDSMTIASLGIELRTQKKNEVIPLDEVRTVFVPTRSVPCRRGEDKGCNNAEFWAVLSTDPAPPSEPCFALSIDNEVDYKQSGFVAGSRYWPSAMVQEVNKRAAKSRATVTITHGQRKAKTLRLASDSTSWIDPKTEAIISVASSEIIDVRFKNHGKGALKGVETGIDAIIVETPDDDHLVLVVFALALLMPVFAIVGAVGGPTDVYRPKQICPENQYSATSSSISHE